MRAERAAETIVYSKWAGKWAKSTSRLQLRDAMNDEHPILPTPQCGRKVAVTMNAGSDIVVSLLKDT